MHSANGLFHEEPDWGGPDWERPDWRRLFALLADDGYDTSPARWQRLSELLAHQPGPTPKTVIDWQYLLAPVLCRRAAEQARFAKHLRDWLGPGEAELSEKDAAEPQSPPVDAPAGVDWSEDAVGQSSPPRFNLFHGLLLAVVLIGGLLVGGWTWLKQDPDLCQELLSTLSLSTIGCPAKPPGEIGKASGLPPQPSLNGPSAEGEMTYPLPTDLIKIRPGISPPNWSPTWQVNTPLASGLRWIITLLPVGIALLFWLGLWSQRRLLAERQAGEPDARSVSLNIKRAEQGILSTPATGRALRALREPITLADQFRINWRESIAETVRRGPLTLRYSGRRIVPGVVILIAQRQSGDWQLSLGELLQTRLQAAGFAHVEVYTFQGQAQRLYPLPIPPDDSLSPLEIDEFSRKYRHDRVLVVADGFRLLNLRTLEPQDWLQHLRTLTAPMILSTGALSPRVAASFRDRGLSLLPFGKSDSTPGVSQSLLHLPFWPWAELDEDFDNARRWQELEDYFGPHAWRLFCTACLYPEFDLTLALALDLVLFPEGEATRLDRVLRLAVTPWAGRAWVPDPIRQRAMRSLRVSGRRQAIAAYESVFGVEDAKDHLPPQPGLQVRISRRKLLTWFQKHADYQDDAVFLSWLAGGWRRQLAFVLPRLAIGTVRLGQSTGWSLAFLGALTLIASTMLWQSNPGGPTTEQRLVDATVNYTSRQAPLAAAVNTVLRQAGVNVLNQRMDNPEAPSVQQIRQDNQISNPLTGEMQALRLIYPPEAEIPAKTLAAYIRELNGGGGIERQTDPNLTNEFILTLGEPTQMPETQGFRDTVRALTKAEMADFSPKLNGKESEPAASENQPISIHEIQRLLSVLKRLKQAVASIYQPERDTGIAIVPEMRRLPGGRFMMGSPPVEPEPDGNEDPQREVTLAPFGLMVNEVTFAEYDRFAGANGRKLPDDEGWGRGRRPVIHVSWDDAAAYAEWLSEQTGKRYFLPSEAQWEYAARAGTTTPFAFGDCLNTDQANYNGNDDYHGCGAETGVYREKTVSVDALAATNAYGLRHMHGNVWEWVQDCWHDNYQGAPIDGEAWEKARGRDCTRRVLRGGGWFSPPRNLRSAFRYRFASPMTPAATSGFVLPGPGDFELCPLILCVGVA